MGNQTPTLELDYNPTIPASVLVQLEAAARSIGLPLGQVELLGQETTTARLFVSHVQDGSAWHFLEQVAWEQLEDLRVQHSVVPAISLV